MHRLKSLRVKRRTEAEVGGGENEVKRDDRQVGEKGGGQPEHCGHIVFKDFPLQAEKARHDGRRPK